MLELNSFKSSTKRSRDQLLSDIEKLGGMVQCITTRENIFYCVDILRENVAQGLDIIAETVFDPLYPDEEIEESKDVIRWSASEMLGAVISRDVAQLAAFSGSPLSNHHFCPETEIDKLNRSMLLDFKRQQFFGPNCLIAGAGIDHATLVGLVKERFSQLPASSPSYVPRKPSIYTGGLQTSERELKEPFTRVCIGFKCGGWSDDSLVGLCVLQTLLGGGSSFSAGGPGT